MPDFALLTFDGSFPPSMAKHLAADQALTVAHSQHLGKAAKVARLGWTSPETAMDSMFSRQAAIHGWLETMPRL